MNVIVNPDEATCAKCGGRIISVRPARWMHCPSVKPVHIPVADDRPCVMNPEDDCSRSLPCAECPEVR